MLSPSATVPLISSIENRPIKASFRSLPTVPDWSVRIPALDGLRGIAILMVLLRHSVFGMETSSKFLSPFLVAGQLTWSGVDLFFVLSGFLIGGILLDAKNSPRYFKTFYIRRAYRIFPIYGVVTALFLSRHLLAHFLPGMLGEASPLTIPWASYATLTQNFWMAHLGWFGPVAMTATWSLAIEEQFYLTAPLLIRRVKLEHLTVVLAAVVVGAPILRALLHYYAPHGDFACYVLMPCRADALCLGVLSAMLVRNLKLWDLLRTNRIALNCAVVVLFAGVAFMTYEKYDPFSSPMNTLGYSWLALFYTCCLLIAVSRSTGPSHLALCNRGLMRLGTVAYCAYLLHIPLIHAGRRVLESRFHESPATWFAGGMLGVAATLAVAALSWKFFEKPLLRRGHAYRY